MIKASELRIGNWVKTPNQPFFIIDGFEYLCKDSGKVEMSSEENTHPLTWWLYNIDPIPLTPELLERAGFEKTRAIHKPIGVTGVFLDFFTEYYDYRKGNMVCNASNEWDDIEVEYGKLGLEQRAFITRCKYLHQLQNLYFALTGEELTISDLT